jgi:hypothetical protein
MHTNYKGFITEARRHKQKQKGPKRGRGGGGVDQWLNQQARTFDKKGNTGNLRTSKEPTPPSSTGMPMKISERLKYVLTKISAKNNRIAKELLSALDKPDARFSYSYLDLTGRDETMSYVNKTGLEVPEDQRYEKNNGKRQYAKVYKTIKQIFGAKYTSAEVKKFVSMYKEVYSAGPPKDVPRPKPSSEQVIKKITEDTKNNKLLWEIEASHKGSGQEWVRLNTIITITLNKKLFIQLTLFTGIRDETLSILTINLLNELGKTSEERRIFIANYRHGDIIDLIRAIRDKFKITAE